MNKLEALWQADIYSLSPVKLVITIIITLIVLILFVLMIMLCYRIEKYTGLESYSALKIGLLAAVPAVYTVCGMFEVVIPFWIIATVFSAVAVLITVWNLITFKIAGLMFSLYQIVLGMLAGLGVAALIFAALAIIALLFFGGGSVMDSSSASVGSTPSYVRDVNSGESYRVTSMNGTMYLPDRGNAILRQADYSGRYFDDSGNNYVSG